MKREIVSYHVNLQEGVQARVYVNDLPIFRRKERGQRSQNGGLNEKLVNGVNELRIELYRADHDPFVDREPRDEMDRKVIEQLRERLAMSIFKAGPGGEDDIDMITREVFPDWWRDVPEERQRLPYHHVVKFDPGVPLHECAWQHAPPADIPCRGTPDLFDAVEAYHRALLEGERDALVDLMSLQMEEFYLAYEGSGVSMQEQREAYEEFFQDEDALEVMPLEGSQLHFGSRAGGRVVEVTRVDDQPVIVAFAKDGMAHFANPLLTRHEGRWQIM